MTTNLSQFTAFQPAAAADTAVLMKMLSPRGLEFFRLIDDEVKYRKRKHLTACCTFCVLCAFVIITVIIVSSVDPDC